MNRYEMINRLKRVLPYNDKWYLTLTDKQVFCIYYKYIINNQKTPKKKNYVELLIEEENVKVKKKTLIKRKTINGYKFVLADNGKWEEEID